MSLTTTSPPTGPLMPTPTPTPLVPAAAPATVSPGRAMWLSFKKSRSGYWSLVIFMVLFVISMLADVLSNDKPLIARYNGDIVFPIAADFSEKRFGGDFDSPADYHDPFIRDQFRKNGNWAIYPPNQYRFDTLNYFSQSPTAAPFFLPAQN